MLSTPTFTYAAYECAGDFILGDLDVGKRIRKLHAINRKMADDKTFIFDKLSVRKLLEMLAVVEPQTPIKQALNRSEILTKVITTLIGLSASLVATYYAVKWVSKAIDPTKKEKAQSIKRAEELLRQIGVGNVTLSEYELCIAANLIDPVSVEIGWEDIAGLDDIIEQVKESVILPFQRQDLFSNSELLQPPKGILLYGPPGCGKTMIAKATAKAAGARFINLQVSSLFDKWYGESEKRTEAVFSLACKLQPAIIFIDEIDAFLRSRSSTDHEATAMMKTQFMTLWDGVITDVNRCVVVMGATNRPADVDVAILRRMPCKFKISLPLCADIDFGQLSDSTEGFSGSDLRETCRIAALNRLKSYIKAEHTGGAGECIEERAMNMSDLTLAVGKMRNTKLTDIRRRSDMQQPQPADLD